MSSGECPVHKKQVSVAFRLNSSQYTNVCTQSTENTVRGSECPATSGEVLDPSNMVCVVTSVYSEVVANSYNTSDIPSEIGLANCMIEAILSILNRCPL